MKPLETSKKYNVPANEQMQYFNVYAKNIRQATIIIYYDLVCI